MKLNEQQKLKRKLVSRLNKAVYQFRLIEDGDKVLVGLSGGKDSLCLLQLLAEKSKIAHPSFSVEALHVRMSNIEYETSTSYLENFCRDIGVPLHILTTSFDESTDKRKTPCFLCSWNRRKQLFNFAQEHNFTKIALGHHQDDILHTTLMNLMYQGSFSTMPALLQYKKMPLYIIRPLCMIEEQDIIRWAEYEQYEKQIKLCPYEHDSKRTAIKELFDKLKDENPEIRYSIWNALEKENKLVETQ